MKLGPVTKLDKRNKTKSKKFDDDVMSGSCEVIAIFQIYGQFGTIWRPENLYFINSNPLSYKD